MKKDYKATLSLSEIFILRNIFQRYETVKKAKVAYFIARNLTITEDFEKDYRKVTQPTPAILAFDKAKEELIKEHAARDENNKPIRTSIPGRPNTWINSLVDELAYEKAYNELREDEAHAQALIDDAEILEKKQELLEVEHEVTFYQIPFSALPEDADGNLEIMAGDLAVLIKYSIIKDDV